MMRFVRQLQRCFHRNERGVAMTEFVIFLPAWIVIFVGVFALGRLGLDTTKVQMTAQKQMWDAVIPITNSDLEPDIHMTPRSGLFEWGPHHVDLAGDSDNDQQAQDAVEAAIMMLGQGGFGHWGESYGRVKPFELVGSVADFAQVENLTFQGRSDILNDRIYPSMLLDDSVPTDAPSGGLDGILSAVLGLSGIMPALGAGVRYGTVFGEVEDQPIHIAGGQTVAASAHYDILVAPAARKGAQTELTDLIAYGLTQTQETYRDLFYFGENNYGGSSTSGGRYNPDDILGDGMDEIEQEREDAEEELEELCEPFGGVNADCQSCTEAGFDNPDDCFPED